VPGIIGTIQGPNIYHIRMDDPIAPEDEPALREALADLEMERRYSALLAEEAVPRPLRDPESQPASHPEPQSVPQAGSRPKAQTEAQSGPGFAKPAAPRSESRALPLKRRGSVPSPDTQNPQPQTEPAGPNERQINADQHMLINAPNVPRERLPAAAEPLPRDLHQAQRDLHARHLARSFNDGSSMGWYRRVVQRFMAAGREDLLHGAARDVLELPEERVKTTRARVFTDRVKRLAREYGIDLGLDEPTAS